MMLIYKISFSVSDISVNTNNINNYNQNNNKEEKV